MKKKDKMAILTNRERELSVTGLVRSTNLILHSTSFEEFLVKIRYRNGAW